MSEPFLPPGLQGPDFYIAAIGRSGSTMLCNWLTLPPRQLVFVEPFFLRTQNPRLLRIQLANFGMPVGDEEWDVADETAAKRFGRIMESRLAGRRWAFKEVLCSEHYAAVENLKPDRIVICVRNIGDIALSFFEKHRLQGNLNRFDDDWVVDYCLKEAASILEFRDALERRGISHKTTRYEDFTGSPLERQGLASYLGWAGGGAIDSHLGQFDRGFEVERHGLTISAKLRERSERLIGKDELILADSIAERCVSYQLAFGYN